MKRNNIKRVICYGVISLLVVNIGCAANRMNLVENSTVLLELGHTKDVYFSGVNVYQDDENLSVVGKVKSRKYLSKNRMGHVDVTIISPGRKSLKKIGVFHYPRKRPRHGKGSSTFKVQIPIIPPNGAIIRVDYHNSLNIPIEECSINEENDPQNFYRGSRKVYISMIVTKT